MPELFAEKLREYEISLTRGKLETLQINVGRKCNQACRHCHVDAAPWRTEMMDEVTVSRIIEWMIRHKPEIVDITGGAPELSPHFSALVDSAKQIGARVIDRNNLTILEEDGFEWLADYLAENEVEIVASLPCYSAKNVNQQRGNGVFDKSIRGLQKLNNLGYGTSIPLHLVYNPVGANLPGPQGELETDYKEALAREFGIVFNQLFTITNQPIARFAEDLRKQEQWDSYMELLVNAFNPETIPSLMCRNTVSIGMEGELYDCDFNQMLSLPLSGKKRFLWDIVPHDLEEIAVTTADHCLACTAGHGSSCTGQVSD